MSSLGIIHAIRNNDIKQVKKELLEYNKFYIDKFDYNGRTVLNYAISCYEFEICYEIIKAGFNINKQDNYGNTALICACKLYVEDDISEYTLNEYYKFVTFLLDSGADLNIKNNDHEFPLYYACCNKNIKIIRLLLKHDAKYINNVIEYKDENISYEYTKNTCLTAVVEYDSIENDKETVREIVEMLLAYGADPSVNNAILYTSDIYIVELFLNSKFKIDINVKNKETTALIKASTYGKYDIVKLLLENGANPNCVNTWRWSALVYAILEGYINIVELLLDYHNKYIKYSKMLENNGAHFISKQILGYDYYEILKTGLICLTNSKSSKNNKIIMKMLLKEGANYTVIKHYCNKLCVLPILCDYY